MTSVAEYRSIELSWQFQDQLIEFDLARNDDEFMFWVLHSRAWIQDAFNTT